MLPTIKKKLSEFLEYAIEKFGIPIFLLLMFIKVIMDFLNSCILAGHEIKNFKKNLKDAAKNNYKLGKIMLQRNNITNANFRFWLANLFYPKAPLILYQLSYVNFLQRNFTKSLHYIEKALDVRPDFKLAVELFRKIEKEYTSKL